MEMRDVNKEKYKEFAFEKNIEEGYTTLQGTIDDGTVFSIKTPHAITNSEEYLLKAMYCLMNRLIAGSGNEEKDKKYFTVLLDSVKKAANESGRIYRDSVLKNFNFQTLRR